MNVEKISPKISIIVPTYNVEPYLHRSLDSIINQTLSDIEIICIDDASTDDSLSILREYAKIDSRIRVIESDENCGSAVARNLGLDIAAGEFLGFVDPDDFIDLDFYEKLYQRAKGTGADIVKAQTLENDNIVGPFAKDIKLNKFNFTYAFWTAIFLRRNQSDFKIRFLPELRMSQDILFLLRMITASNKIECIDDTFYHHTLRNDSAAPVHDFLTLEKISNYINAVKLMFDFINQSNLPKSDYLASLKNMLSGLLEISRKNTREDAKLLICESYVNFCQRSKFIGDLRSIIEWNCYSFVRSEDPIGLSKYLLNIQSHELMRSIIGNVPKPSEILD